MLQSNVIAFNCISQSKNVWGFSFENLCLIVGISFSVLLSCFDRPCMFFRSHRSKSNDIWQQQTKNIKFLFQTQRDDENQAQEKKTHTKTKMNRNTMATMMRKMRRKRNWQKRYCRKFSKLRTFWKQENSFLLFVVLFLRFFLSLVFWLFTSAYESGLHTQIHTDRDQVFPIVCKVYYGLKWYAVTGILNEKQFEWEKTRADIFRVFFFRLFFVFF